jgi:hypothetical protein
LVHQLARLWSVDESHSLPKEVDVIALVSIGSAKTRLSQGAAAITKKALELLKKHPEAKVVFGAFAGNSKNSIPEEDVKKQIFGNQGLYAGKVWTTITECLAYKAIFTEAKSVIFVTEEAHSRRGRIVWKCLWPEAKVYVVSVKLSETIDTDSDMSTYHSPWKALFLQAMPTPIYKIAAIIGPATLKLLSRIHQPTSP